MIINPYLFRDPVYNGITAAYPLSEDSIYMHRDVMYTGMDFFPTGVTSLNGYTVFNGTNAYMTTDASHINLSSGESFTCCITLKPTSLTGTRWIMAKGRQIYANDGQWSLYHSTTTINFRMHRSNDTSITVSANITNGVDNVITFGYDAVNQLISIKVNAGSVVTAAQTLNVKSNAGPLCIGGPQNRWTQTAEFYNGAAKNLMFWKGTYLTSTQQATLYTLGFPYSALANQSISLDPEDLSDKNARYDFGDESTMWQDLGESVPVVNNNDPVRRINSLWNGKYATAPSDPVRPLLKTGSLNGRSTVYSNGTDSELNMDAPLQTALADITIILIAKNDRNGVAPDYGSHFLHSNVYQSYVSYTGTGYTGTYLAAHKSKSGTGFAPNSGTLNNPTGYNTAELWCSGSDFALIENGDEPTTLASYKGVNTNPADYDTFFRETVLGGVPGRWWAWGNIAECIVVDRCLTVAERARVRQFLKDKWDVPNTFFRGY